jgi:hypothetical protein
MPIGAKIIDAIDEAIPLRDKVLLILPKNAIESAHCHGTGGDGTGSGGARDCDTRRRAQLIQRLHASLKWRQRAPDASRSESCAASI